jgi:hypothetical protein
MVSLTNITAQTGGFVIIPRSHIEHKALFQQFPELKTQNDHLVNVKTQHVRFCEQKPILLSIDAGDMLIWDNRCLYSNYPSLQMSNNFDELSRLSAYVCCVPSDHYLLSKPEILVQARQKAFKEGLTTNYWPLDVIPVRILIFVPFGSRFSFRVTDILFQRIDQIPFRGRRKRSGIDHISNCYHSPVSAL